MIGGFTRRHIGPSRIQINEMLEDLGLSSLEELIDKTVPDDILCSVSSSKEALSEENVYAYTRSISTRNKVLKSMIGMGYSNTLLPAVIKRNVLENPGWYTAYTPYQSEVSQGRLEALLNYQRMIIDLTGMKLANASLLDEATAAAEAMAMTKRIVKGKAITYFVDENCYPQTIAVLKTRAKGLGFDIRVGDPETQILGTDIFGMYIQYPNSQGQIYDFTELADKVHNRYNGLLTVGTDLLALVLLKSPGEFGADIVVGNSQRFGVPMGYGGPHAAFFATHDKYKRQMPGRVIGVSVDSQGEPALRMALQTREQHIRREKATSNICTSQALLAIIASFYAIYHGKLGLERIAKRVQKYTSILASGLRMNGYKVLNDTYFDTITIRAPGVANRVISSAMEAGINLRKIDSNHLGVSFDETTQREDIRTILKCFPLKGMNEKEVTTYHNATTTGLFNDPKESIPKEFIRTDDILDDLVFEKYHSETEMMRYMRRLSRKDIALDRSMIPLGSCTMKLNSATEMQAISFNKFANMHPFVPLEQAQGYQQLFTELEEMLCRLTGFDAFSLQPNAGSQGEFAGLMCIRKFHESNNEEHRNICLIPASAHGTNPASATLAGLKVVVVKCDDEGNVDIHDLREKIKENRDDLAALMITYPSTHGVFETSIKDICRHVHDAGGQIYFDGANFNAMVGISKPAPIGADVAHINLHKTFAIPHGGGGPGMGPIGVKSHLAPYLPDHPVVEGVNPAESSIGTIGTISAAPWGSASILTISWAYIAMLETEGLKRATMVAILNANYIANRLSSCYKILYTGELGMVAHECIIDFRHFKEQYGLTVDDVAKRLVDYGFHAPTVSFPVPETMMIEPTESEGKTEIDRFCDALILIASEVEECPDIVRNAPHVPSLLMKDWIYDYSKERAFYPMSEIKEDKYWPPVGKIDNVFGDRNFGK